MGSINDQEFSRNYGFWNEAEQQTLLAAHIAIAGVGGDGYQLGQRLAMMGVSNFTIADPEVFEPENANRVPGATTLTYGMSKAEVFRNEILSRRPDAQVRIFHEGVSPDNVSDFLEGATLVFDESELTKVEIGTAVAREARKRHIADVLVMNVGPAAQVTSFHPDSSHTFERFMGIPDDMPLAEVAKQKVAFSRCLPYIPKDTDLRTFNAVLQGAPLPSIAIGVDVASALGSAEARKHLFAAAGNRRQSPTWAPRIAWMDADTQKAGSTRYPRMSHYRHLVHAATRQALHLNPAASYTDADRLRRASVSE